MFDFWYDLPPMLRAIMGLVMLVIAVVIFFATRGMFIAIGLAVVGFMFMAFAGAGHNKDGYNF